MVAIQLTVGCDDGIGYPIRAKSISVGGSIGSAGTSNGTPSIGGVSAMTSGGTASGGTASGGTASGGTAMTSDASGGTATGGTAMTSDASGGTAAFGTATGGRSQDAWGGTNSGGGTATSIAFGGASASGGLGAVAAAGGPAFCVDPLNWPTEATNVELEMLNDINVLRQSGYACPNKPSGIAAAPLTQVEDLRCLARSVAIGVAPFQDQGEILAISEPSNVDVGAVLRSIMNPNSGQCASLMDPRATSIGIGFSNRSRTDAPGFWAIELGNPRRSSN
ncbi:MAG TPA: hypothetical protein VIV60_18820 [Polyangiaceae bacterium]